MEANISVYLGLFLLSVTATTIVSGGQATRVELPCIGFFSGDDVTWKKNINDSFKKVAALQSSTGKFHDAYNPSFSGRVKINPSNGTLYMRKVTSKDSGMYMCEMPSNTDERLEPRRSLITLVVTSCNEVTTDSSLKLVPTVQLKVNSSTGRENDLDADNGKDPGSSTGLLVAVVILSVVVAVLLCVLIGSGIYINVLKKRLHSQGT